MRETAREYLARMERYLGDDDPFDVLRSTPRALRRLVAGAPRRRLTSGLAPGKWSAIEILSHLADVDLVWGYRIRKILEEPGARIQPMEQDRWVEECRYAEARADEALEAFAALRRAGEHGYFGRLTIRKIVRMLAGHDRNHAGQLRRILG
ncbi:MAG TPA: DinB family protein [Thermoanaerobaculia bacterium]|nr:DinB family protein [Thermoanaerobaculia bacterium]